MQSSCGRVLCTYTFLLLFVIALNNTLSLWGANGSKEYGATPARSVLMAKAGYYGNPTLHGDTIIFVCEDDLWTVSTSGGVARRLTVNPGRVASPALSPDGVTLAFAGFDEGTSEVYVMLAEGGEAKRLTFLGATTYVAGWTPDNWIVFASNATQPFGRDYRLYTLDPAGGEPQKLPYGPAMSVSYGPHGGIVIGRNTTDSARWKRYRGGTAGELWVEPEGEEWHRLITLDGNLALPLWLGERIYFVSDHEGVGNLYSCMPQGEDLRRHTKHHDFYVRFPTTDGKRIVYQAGADLYLFDPSSDLSERIPITLGSPKAQQKRRFVDPPKYLSDFLLNRSGKSLALTTRGQAFSLRAWEGPVIRHGDSELARFRLPSWLYDERLLVVRDKDSEVTLELHPTGPDADLAQPEHLAGLDLGRPLEVVPSPQRAEVALTNHRNELLLVNLGERTVQQLDKSGHGRVQGVAWSPDGRYLAYGFQATPSTCGLKLCEVESGETWKLTEPVLWDHAPSFDPKGNYLYFISYRTFDPVYDNLHLDLGFPKGGKPCLLTLRADLPSPFSAAGQAQRDDRESDKEVDDGKVDEHPEAQTTHIEIEGIADRIVAFPVPEGRYSDVHGVKDKVLYLSHPVEGALEQNWLGADEPLAKAKLECYDFEGRKNETLVEGVTSFTLSQDGSTLCYRAGNRLRVLKTGDKPPGDKGEEPGRESGWIDLSRVKVSVNPAAEWRQMFRDAWRLQLEHFWTEDMSGIDWNEVYRRYEPLLARVASRGELSDLVWEMQGELGTSHAYELGGDYRESPQYPQGFLGADLHFDPESDAYEVTHIVKGDLWDENASSPLARAGVNVRVGDKILAVNRQRVGRDVSPQSLLVHQAGSEVLLTVEAVSDNAVRTVVIKALESEQPARYREWVERNRRYVHEQTDGQIGYVHIPDMGPHGYAEFHRGFLKESERTGLIVDVRFNGGGHVSPLIIEKLARRRLGYSVARWREPAPFPQLSLAGPLVALTNEHAGSDGDIFCHTFKLMQLGPLIGKRTWGGVVGITVNDPLGDGTITTQPEFSFWFQDVGFGVENYGTDPTIEVDNRPQDYQRGDDVQLRRAVEEALTGLTDRGFKPPDFSKRPRLALALSADD